MLLFQVEDTIDFKFTATPTVGVSYIGQPENEIFFTINSIDATKKQSLAKKLNGRKVRLTVELVEDEEEKDVA